MKKTYTIIYPISYSKGTNKKLTVKGTYAQVKQFAEVYGLQHGFGQVMIQEAA